ncbi:MAG: hypothetical protein K8S21_01375 [Gemmatimonadetes bacterium]|nr:hypothetical protein [Gemmatimonadota bacterium]
MIRRSLPLVLAALVAAPLGAQVGHTPENSPFEDLRGKQALTIFTGSVAPGGDPAGVGPRTGLQLGTRYELLLTGPLWLQVRATYAPSLERTVKDPVLTGAARELGTSTRPLAAMEAGFGLNLTGNKSWHRVTPQLHGAFGFVTGGTKQFDPGGYRFGNKFTVSYGLGLRIVTGREWEVQADVTHLFWKYSYPNDYRVSSSSTVNTSILQGGPLTQTKGNAVLSIGMSRFFFR